MATNKNYELRIKRNATTYDSKSLALEGIKTELESCNEGAFVLAIYTSDDKEYTLLGVKGRSDIQIFEGASIDEEGQLLLPDEIQKKIALFIGNLNYTDDGYDNAKYVSKVTQSKGVVAAEHVDLLSSDSDNVLTLKNGSIYLSSVFDCGEYH